MKILLFANKDIHANLAYHLLKKTLAKHEVEIYYSEAVGAGRPKPKDLQKLEYFEKEFFFEQVAPLVKSKSIPTDFEFLGQDVKGYPIEQWGKVNGEVFINRVEAWQPDLLISIRFAKIFHQRIIQIPRHGVLNLHSGILPDYRGILGTLHALKEGQKEVGCTLHFIQDKTIDSGGIINIARQKVEWDKSLFWHVNALYSMGCAMVIEAIEALASEATLVAQTQDMGQGNYYSLPTEKDFELLKKAGFPVILRKEYLNFIAQWIAPELADHLFFDLD